MTVIDHKFFPHLIDLIWENLDFEGQTAAKRACKQWRRRANARLQHIVLSCFERPGDVIDIATRDLSKPSSHAWLGQICHWHDSRAHEWAHYGYYYDYDDWGRRKKFKYTKAEKLANRLEYKVSTSAKVVDFVGFDQGRPYVPSNLSYNSFIQAVLLESRCIVRWYGHFPDLSDFQDFALNSFHTDLPPSLVDVFMFELKPDTPFDSLSSWELEEHDTVQVANYLCLCDPTASDSGVTSLWNEDRNMEVCPVTVIFENDIPQENRTPPQMDPGPVAAYGDLVHGGSEVIIVGLDQFLDPNDMNRYIEAVEREVLRGRYLYDSDVDNDVWWVPERSSLNNLRFMTHEQYQELVGRKVYRIHTMR